MSRSRVIPGLAVMAALLAGTAGGVQARVHGDLGMKAQAQYAKGLGGIPGVPWRPSTNSDVGGSGGRRKVSQKKRRRLERTARGKWNKAKFMSLLMPLMLLAFTACHVMPSQVTDQSALCNGRWHTIQSEVHGDTAWVVSVCRRGPP